MTERGRVERPSDRWVSIALSVTLHGALVGALAYGFWTYHKSRAPTPTLAIQATVVDPHSLSAAPNRALPQPKSTQPKPTPAPETQTTPPPPPQPPPEEPTGPPEPTPEELAQRQQAEKEQQEKAQAEQQAAEQRRLEEQKQQEQQRQDEQKRQEEQKRQAKAEAERKAAAKKREAQRLAEQKRQEEAQRQSDEQEKAQMEANLKQDLAAEERANTARSSGALASWEAQIAARIRSQWNPPATAKPGIECVLDVTQIPGGQVVNVQIASCNADQAVRDSIQVAAYRASPLPPPPDPSLFERNLEITFKPN